MAKLIIPTPLRKFTDNNSTVEINKSNVDEAIKDLVSSYPNLKEHLLDENGQIRSFINIFVGENDIKSLDGFDTGISADTVISIVPAIAGGAPVAEKIKSDGVTFSNKEIARYSRHLIIPEFNIKAQRKLKAAKVLCVGTGGLGSPLLLYLSAAGVGTIGIIDFDSVDDSNLQRQVLFGVDSVGQPKVDAAKERLTKLNPFIKFVTYNEQLNSANALDIIKDYDVVADGTDNFPTRYLVNDACVLLNKPNVYASIFQFEGQVSVFNYTNEKAEVGPNYRDLYPTPPPPELVPNCAEGGVLGVLPGIIGSLQALEVIKVITGVGDVLSGRMFLFDALSFTTRVVKFGKDDKNPISGKNPTITELIDYDQFCNIGRGNGASMSQPVKAISVQDLKQMMDNKEDFQLIDVREPFEYEICHLNGELIPLSRVLDEKDRISTDKKVVVHCRSGGRSGKAIEALQEKFGFTNLYNLAGGVLAWSDQIDPTMPKY